MLSDQRPHWLEVLLSGHFKLFILDVHLAHRLKNVACCRNCFSWVCLYVCEGTIEFLVDRTGVAVSDELFKCSRRCSKRAYDLAASDVLKLAFAEDLGDTRSILKFVFVPGVLGI